MKVQEHREALAPHAHGRSISYAHACDIDSPPRSPRTASERRVLCTVS